MSDLCHNCGDCHLGAQAVKCRKELQECIICRSLGHTYNFCPRSVHQLDEAYNYLMLCHNCDSWHLPKACEHELKHCERCQQYGHMVFFCPIDPEPRCRVDEPMGAKRQRVQDAGRELVQHRIAPVTEVLHVHPQLLRDIKLYAVRDAFQLLGAYRQADVLQYFARPVLPPLQAMTSTVQHPISFVTQQQGVNHDIDASAPSAAATSPDGNIFELRGMQHSEQQGQGSPTMLPTPAATTEPQTSTAPESTSSGVYQTMHDRFERGELAMAQDAQETHSDSATQSPAAGSVDTQPKTAGKKKATPKPRRPVMRCATCKKRHMKCKHFDEDGNPEIPGLLPAAPSASGSPNELSSAVGLVYEPRISQLVSQEEQDLIRASNGQKTMQDYITPTDQAMLAELPEFDHTLRKYHGDIDQLGWLDKSKKYAQSALVTDQAASMMPQSTYHDHHWFDSGGIPAVNETHRLQHALGDQAAPTDQELERNLAQMLSEEAGFGPPESHPESVVFGGSASVAFMGTAQTLAPETDAKLVIAQDDGVGNADMDTFVADLVEPPKKKKGGGRKRTKAA
ncbi:hypothetical protein DOTSEDRAFT_27499 [Dothistroma septosporum NZE10]|uniref:Uncharacterized protein n=1 Tax=Dothistroma septosporum (strain NZE10 / CBS 128990) TaxID=675120 RepID=N1PFL3_DOTSN|nr:hypothetical protein DOTSEDRAFT_27499 [Dothistroma septosporum NZE10]